MTREKKAIFATETEIEEFIKNVIRIEKKHLYGLEQSSQKARRDEVSKYLESIFREKLQ